ncbi:MAG: hypothetical protein WCD18_07930 [Thermosynechococcaceae cyanobacterium]
MTHPTYGPPYNPHPLSQMRRSLAWDVKVVDTFGCGTSITVEVEV